MILIDANLLLYAYDSASPLHSRARRWLEATLSGSGLVGLSWPVILAFLRISTNPRALERPLSRQEASSIVSEWLERPQVVVLNPGDNHWSVLRGLIGSAQASGPLIMDAHLAALAIEHGARLCSSDQDFARFSGVDFDNPLKEDGAGISEPST